MVILTPNMVSDSILAPTCWPNWRDAAAYDYLSKPFPDKWAWEYLRRNKDYAAAFSTFLPQWQGCFGKGEYPHPAPTPDPALLELSERICRQFHLFPKGGLRNPNALMEPMFADDDLPHVEVLASWHDGKKLDHRIGTPNSRYCVDVRIGAERPWEEQAERLKAIYANLTRGLKRPKPQRPQHSKNILYLRCFDADRAKVPLREIAGVIYPNEGGSDTSIGRVKKQIAKARALINGGYRVFVQRHWH